MNAHVTSIEEVSSDEKDNEDKEIPFLAARTAWLSEEARDSARRDPRHQHEFLKGPQQTAMLRAIFPEAVFIPKQKYVHAPVKFHSSTIHSKVDALIDSGAT